MSAGVKREMSDDPESQWRRFSSEPTDISLSQASILLGHLDTQHHLDETAAESILRHLEYSPEIREGLIREPYHEDAPNRRLELWRGRSGSLLAAVLWSEGAYTTIHDHSHFALTKVLEGSVTSVGFLRKGEKLLQSLGRVHFEKNRIYHVPAGDGFIHAVANLGRKDAIEIHFYAPGAILRPSFRYDPVDTFKTAVNIRDGDLVEVVKMVDPLQLDQRFGT